MWLLRDTCIYNVMCMERWTEAVRNFRPRGGGRRLGRQSSHWDQGGVCCWQIANLPETLADWRKKCVGIAVVDEGRDRIPLW